MIVLLLLTGSVAAQESSGNDTITVTDALDRRVTVPVNPERATAAGRAVLMVADAIYAFPSARASLVAVSRIDQGKGNFLRAYDSAYADKQILERNAGAEQVAASRPDVVFMKDFMKGSLGDAVERLGIPVVYLRLETPEDYTRDITLLGRIYGAEERAREIVDYIDGRVSFVTERVRPVSTSERPTGLFVYYALQGNEAAVNVPPRGWIQTTLLDQAGARPVWADQVGGGGWQTVNVEQVLTWNPETIFVVSYRNDIRDVVDRIRSDSRWRSLKAVRNDRVHAFPIDYYSWDQPDVRWVLGLQWLAKTLHPEQFEDLDMTDAVYEFFEVMYGMSREETREIVFPVLEGDIETAP
ncbi:MAG: ABC transporter substrate-binding protein [Spirochaetota bacterium]